jgi:muramoyltetrapeptide carboxypeptidase
MKAKIITPSWLMKNRKEFLSGLKNLEKLGIEPVNPLFPKTIPSPQKKATELHKAFLDKNIELVIAQRGGYSSIKTLPFIDYSLIKKHPKLLAGFSDMSALLNTVFELSGIVTLHSPMVMNLSNPTPFTVRSFKNALAGFPEKDLFKGAPVEVYKKGTARGTLKGGNLVTLTSMIGTKWETKTDNSIIFLEDVDEKIHEIDRYLTMWLLNGKFRGVKGLILGDFRGAKNMDVFRVLESQMKINFPVVHCPYIGHVKNKITLPVGARVELDTFKRTLKIL